jgi:hypothetical protein
VNTNAEAWFLIWRLMRDFGRGYTDADLERARAKSAGGLTLTGRERRALEDAGW